MDLEHKYNYTRRPPSVTHRDAQEIVYVGHRMGYTKRKDELRSTHNIDYNAWCICGWADEDDLRYRKWVAFRHLTTRYVKYHIEEVKKQGVLRV